MNVKFYKELDKSVNVKYVVIVARYQKHFVFCKHKERQTYELPGGHIEPNEDILTAAKRELEEETAAINYTIKFITYYSYNNYGALFFANITELGNLKNEIESIKLADYMPIDITYPHIQPRLFNYVIRNTEIDFDSNYKRMIAGALYRQDDYGRKLHNEAQILTYKYNQTKPDEYEKRKQILKKLFGSIKGFCYLEPTIKVDYGCNVHIGDGFYANFDTVFLDVAPIVFGDNIYIAPRCCFYTAGHPIDKDIRNEDYEYGHPIRIGSDVWIGGSTVINPGVTIGSNVVIGSGSVVTKDIPSNVVAAGNPCRVIREITEEDKIKWQNEKNLLLKNDN